MACSAMTVMGTPEGATNDWEEIAMLTIFVAFAVLALCALIVATLPWYWAALVIACVVLVVRILIGIINLPDAPGDYQIGND